MEATNATSSVSPHTPILAIAGGGFIAPPSPPPIRTSFNQIPTTSCSGTIPTMTMTIVPSIKNMCGAPFSYEMPGFDSSLTLPYSTL
jgi:hypothetical protein